MSYAPRVPAALFHGTATAILAALVAVVPSTALSQAFDVNTFRPWAGYSIPNGLWFTGDFNGDGKSDVFHAVASGDYAHVWTSTGAGAFTMSTFRPWPGYSIPNGVWLPGDYDGNGKTDMFHAVASGDYAHVWTSIGGGAFTMSTFRPWPGYSIPNGVWLAGDFNGDGKTDVFHAVASGDYAHVWTSTGGAFTMSTFRPWSGYSIPNGVWRVGDFNGDGKADVFHAVASGDYAHIWISNGAGSFTVATFRPWAGYSIPNGEWLTGDFNGDGKTDIFHAVASGGYAHVWTSTGAGTFSVATFQPWPGYAIPNGVWLAGDVDHDGKTDIVHAVANTDYANIWRSAGNGSFTMRSFSPWAGYAIPNGVWLVGDFNADAKADIFHAVASGDYAHPWLSVLPGPNEVALDGLEVTQAIQNMAHTVTLVANKTTWVRAYLSANASSPMTVSGTLRVRNTATGATTTINSTATTTLLPAQFYALQPKRESITGSLNFIVPAGFTVAGTRQVALTTVTSGGSALQCSNCAAGERTVSLVASSPLRVRLVGIQYAVPPSTTNNAPAAIDFTLAQSWLGRAYPTGQVIATQTTVTSTTPWAFTCNDANAQLAAMRTLEIANNTSDTRTHYFGLVSVAGGYMRGCAAGIPGTVASGPTGNPSGGTVPINVAGDPDASFGDWYAGHELGHTYGRFHPGFCNGNSADDASFPNPNGQISDNAGTFTGLDVGDAGNSITPIVLPGASRFDIMTYCNQPQWLSAYAYEGIRARLNAENPAGTGAPSGGAPSKLLASLPIDPQCGCERVAVAALRAPPQVRVGQRAPAMARLAAESAPPLPPPALERAQQPPESARRFDSSAVVPARRFPVDVERAFVPMRSLVPDQAATPPARLQAGDYVNVVATVNITRNVAKILYVNRVQRGEIPVGVNDVRAAIRVIGRNDRVLATVPVEVKEATDIPPGQDRVGIINAMIPFNAAAARIEIVLSGRLVATRLVSANAPQLRTTRSSAFTVQSTEGRSQPAIRVQWDGVDSDRDTLTYTVEIAPIGSTRWEAIAVGLQATELVLTSAQFADRKSLQVRITASDGYNQSAPLRLIVNRP